MNIESLNTFLNYSYSIDTCYFKVVDNWSDANPTIGHCAIVSLIVNDYFGGKIFKCDVDGIYHYFNIINGDIVDLTKEQFKTKINYKDRKEKTREELLNNKDTNERYIKLKKKLELKILDSEIANCNKCDNLVEKFPNSNTVSIGKCNDIVILGEAPANNGWRKSGIAWYDINGKLLPSGVVLEKLLKIINIKLNDTYFLEAVKCFPKNRNYLKKCNNNCFKYAKEQIKIINPKIVLVLGDSAFKAITDIKYKKYSEVVGNIYEIDRIKYIPIYHPSPISPKSYEGNIPIFNKIKDEIV